MILIDALGISSDSILCKFKESTQAHISDTSKHAKEELITTVSELRMLPIGVYLCGLVGGMVGYVTRGLWVPMLKDGRMYIEQGTSRVVQGTTDSLSHLSELSQVRKHYAWFYSWLRSTHAPVSAEDKADEAEQAEEEDTQEDQED